MSLYNDNKLQYDVQYLTVSKSYLDNCTCSLTEQNTTFKESALWSDTNVKQNMILKKTIRSCLKRFICLKNVIILSICCQHGSNYFILVQSRHIPKGSDVQ